MCILYGTMGLERNGLFLCLFFPGSRFTAASTHEKKE